MVDLVKQTDLIKSSFSKTKSGLQIGDHLLVCRNLYTHHGLYIGEHRVIHYAGLADGLRKDIVKIDTLEDFIGEMGKSGLTICPHPQRQFSAQDSVLRAKGCLGEDKYNVIFNNCEHFVNWCIEGENYSPQVVNTVKTTTIGAIAGVVLGIVGVVLVKALNNNKSS